MNAKTLLFAAVMTTGMTAMAGPRMSPEAMQQRMDMMQMIMGQMMEHQQQYERMPHR